METALEALSPTFRELLSDLYRSRQILDPDTKVIRRLRLGRENAQFAAGAICGVAQDYLDQWRGNQVSGYVPPDRRGPQRAYHRLFGDPRMFLADQVAQLLVTYQPELKLTADPNGDLYGVVVELWIYATGLPEDGYDLRKFARRSAKSAETLKAAQKYQTQIADLEQRLQILNGPPMRYEEMRPLLRQLNTLQTRSSNLIIEAQEASFGR